ncbi:MAG: hypothetical protein KJO91_09895, partial [Gammaproteobacteria bacterium]|nr:hypothetical protein [Gammaproteobacteria bacterium]
MLISLYSSYHRSSKFAALLLTMTILGGLAVPAAADPMAQPLLSESDIAYVGRFALPDGGSEPATYAYGGYGMAFYKQADGTNTLFVSGHVYGTGYYGQVQVPSDAQLKSASTGYSGLVQATVIQKIANAMEGHGEIENNYNPNWSL